ncbi:MAG: dTDP-4-dehydrorhamnose reductase [Gemmatimonadaceae bacterium]|nr:dTDP-4-dehydrorhamnose reductase [Chitinophagaceae bacterium]
MEKPVIIVTGANGQLGKELRVLAIHYTNFEFRFLAKEDLAINQFQLLRDYFLTYKPAYCINCAAYTAVDKAESEKEMAMLINGEAPGILAEVCRESGTRFVHISTDYVFDGTATTPYRETDSTNPVNFYGATKLAGEESCQKSNPDSIIIRTSWVYSEFGHNFVKTMRRLMKERESLSVVNDQFGSPTYAADLARCILFIIAAAEKSEWKPGIYNYSNEGVISWFDFAVAIKEITGAISSVNPIPTSAFPTPAKRPAWSVLDKQKIKHAYPEVPIPEWQESLRVCLSHLTLI